MTRVCTQICFRRFWAVETFFWVVHKNAFFSRENLSPRKILGSHDLSWRFSSAGGVLANSKNGQISKFSILKKTMMINQGGVMLVVKMNTYNGPFKNGVRIFFQYYRLLSEKILKNRSSSKKYRFAVRADFFVWVVGRTNMNTYYCPKKISPEMKFSIFLTENQILKSFFSKKNRFFHRN